MADATPTPAPAAPTPAPVPAVAPAQPSNMLAIVLVFNSLLIVGLAVGFMFFLYHQVHPSAPVKPYDAAFVKVGESYGAHLAPTCGAAWSEAADMLDAGQPYSTCMAHAGTSWTAGRQQFFDQIVTPELGKIVPEGTKDADVTAAQRVKASAAWRGYARGLGAK